MGACAIETSQGPLNVTLTMAQNFFANFAPKEAELGSLLANFAKNFRPPITGLFDMQVEEVSPVKGVAGGALVVLIVGTASVVVGRRAFSLFAQRRWSALNND